MNSMLYRVLLCIVQMILRLIKIIKPEIPKTVNVCY